MISRRTFGAGAVAGAAALVAGCGGRKKPAALSTPYESTRVTYGHDDPAQQFGYLSRPNGASSGTSAGTAILLHGGYWLAGYGLDQLEPMTRTLVGEGWTVWNLEYRRLGRGGGWPMTYTDAAAGIDHLATLDVDTDRAVLLGHSAGGTLAAWAASRTARTPGGRARVKTRGAISLSGVLDMTLGASENLGGGAVTRVLGGTPTSAPDHYALGDPSRLKPDSPVLAVHAREDTVVPLDQDVAYVSAARRLGGSAHRVTVSGTHFTLIDPTASSWPTIRAALEAAVR